MVAEIGQPVLQITAETIENIILENVSHSSMKAASQQYIWEYLQINIEIG